MDNAVLLRADVRLLLDSCVLRFNVGSDSATIDFAEEGSPTHEGLRDTRLPISTLQRVERALRSVHGAGPTAADW